MDLANGVSNVDAVIGDHTDQQVLTTTANGVLVTENRSKGLRFTRVRLVIGPGKEGVVYKTADFHKPFDIGVTPNAAIQAKIDGLNAQLAPIFNKEVGKSTVVIPRGRRVRGVDRPRRRQGLRVADRRPRDRRDPLGLRDGLRADQLGRPPRRPDVPDRWTTRARTSVRPSLYPVPDATGKYPITRGQVLGVLPFGNVSATLTINGAELKDYLETAVSSLPATGNGRFAQVSGLCFTFNVEGTPASFAANGIVVPGTGNRVTGAVRQAADGSCTGAAVSFSSGVNYTLTTNDFTAGGGDGYPNNRSRITTQDILDQDLADYLAAVPGGVVSPVDPAPDPLHRSEPGQWRELPGRLALDRPRARGPAASRGGPSGPSASATATTAAAPAAAATIHHVELAASPVFGGGAQPRKPLIRNRFPSAVAGIAQRKMRCATSGASLDDRRLAGARPDDPVVVPREARSAGDLAPLRRRAGLAAAAARAANG